MTKQNRRFRHKTIAVIYDFDGTLTPKPMQEYTILPKLGVPPKSFWNKVKQEALKTNGDEMLTYMRLLIETLESKKEHLNRSDLAKLGKQVPYFSGVGTWFNRINTYVQKRSKGVVKIEN